MLMEKYTFKGYILCNIKPIKLLLIVKSSKFSLKSMSDVTSIFTCYDTAEVIQLLNKKMK